MPFVSLSNNEGKFYVPEHDADSPRKHPCQNCFSCQVCSEDRCRICLNPHNYKMTASGESDYPCPE